MPICASCNQPTEWSNSVEHPAPFVNAWLCKTCLDKLGGLVNPIIAAVKAALEQERKKVGGNP